MEEIAVGRIRTSWGVRGVVKVQSYSGEYDHFGRMKEIRLSREGRDRVLKVEWFRREGDLALMKLDGIDNPEDARLLANSDIWVPREQAAPLEEGEYYHADLCRCTLWYGDECIGKVRAVVPGGNGELLEIRGAGGRTILVPFNGDFIGEIDIADERIELKEHWIVE